MTEEVHTGGLKKFVREKGIKETKIEPELERKIDEAYEKASQRKRRNRIIITVIILILLLILLGIFLFR